MFRSWAASACAACALASTALAVACLPAPLDPEGKLCDAERGCGVGFLCGDDGFCVRQGTVTGTGGEGNPDGSGEDVPSTPDGSVSTPSDADAGVPPNLLVNGDFEEGQPPTGWRVSGTGQLETETQRVFQGVQAARAQADNASSNQMTLQPTAELVGPESGRTYCARARVYGSDNESTVRLQLRERTGSTTMAESFSPALNPTGGGWHVLTTMLISQGSERLDFRLFLNSPTQNEYMIVDSAELWRSNAGGCSERE